LLENFKSEGKESLLFIVIIKIVQLMLMKLKLTSRKDIALVFPVNHLTGDINNLNPKLLDKMPIGICSLHMYFICLNFSVSSQECFIIKRRFSVFLGDSDTDNSDDDKVNVSGRLSTDSSEVIRGKFSLVNPSSTLSF
jgi:hypothetical protein